MKSSTQVTIALLVIVLGVGAAIALGMSKSAARLSGKLPNESSLDYEAPKPQSTPLASLPPTPPATPAMKQNPTAPTPVERAQLPAELTHEDQKRLTVLDEILKSHNDNDLRLDRDFRHLTPEMKAALRDKYAATPNESRNAKGTVAFLLGREIKTPEDIAFLESILTEPACLSLQDCAHKPSNVDEHAAMANEVTIVYPQLVAIQSLQNYLRQASADDPARQPAINALIFAERSPQAKIATAAQRAINALHL